MSSTTQPGSDLRSQFIGDDLQDNGGHPIQHNQPYIGYNGLLSQPLLTASIPPPFPPNVYPLIDPPEFVGLESNANGDSNLLTEASRVQHISWGGEVRRVPETENVDLQLDASGTVASLPAAPPIRYLHTGLPVISAEQHDERRYPRRPAPRADPEPDPPILPVDNAPNSKKRGRQSTDREPGGPTEATKRSRGRPRLETKDQTPTERRRTQIRLAQRAYRNRKESAITDLQARIDDLRNVNNEINSAYQNLYDYASQRGLLAQAPEFGQQLQRLQTLIKQTREQNNPKPSEQEDLEASFDDGLGETRTAASATVANEEPDTTVPEGRTSHLQSGLAASREPVVQQGASVVTSNLDANLNATLNNPQANEYEIVAAPTLENASFGPNLSIDTNFVDPSQSSWATHPWNRLTGPQTMSFTEWAFARRLHRYAVERAAALIAMPSPPPAKLSRVFGFVMLFETVDEIKSRTRATLNRVRDEPLNYWEHPFHRLGGSGTHFSGPSSLSGSSTYESTGFGMGPFNERVTRVRDTLLGASQYINISGWEGTWYDSGEVETYLAQNGIVIPTAADVHIVEVQPGAFSDVRTQPHIQLLQTIPPSAMPASYANPPFAYGMSADIPPATGSDAFSAGPNAAHSNTFTSSTQNDLWPPISVTSSLYGTAQTSDADVPSFTGFDNMTANIFPNTSSYLFPYQEPAATAPREAPRRVVLDVNQFISGLISHATCLGRAPAFRPKDIVKAFWDAVISE